VIIRATACSASSVVTLAVNSLASAVLFYNDASHPLRTGLWITSFNASIPVFALTNALGLYFEVIPIPIYLSLTSYFTPINATTYNVIADTKKGKTDNVIVVGSHLDSVPVGAGINDDGSGSALNLELALQVYKTGLIDQIQNQIRFSFWGAEELGLLGSTFYVTDLYNNNPDDFKKLKLNLNFDMVASTNFFRGIYNGTSANEPIRNGSTVIQYLFQKAFDTQSLAWDLTPFTGRSDYGPFIEKGIPAGGLFTGAEVLKTAEFLERYGGLMNVPYDPCYHSACDNLLNINQEVLGQMAYAAAFTLQTLALAPNLDTFLNNP